MAELSRQSDDFIAPIDERFLDELLTAARQIRGAATLVVILTLGTLIMLVATFLVRVYFNYAFNGLSSSSYAYTQTASLYAAVRMAVGISASLIAIAAIMAIAYFENSRRRGDAMFQEVSNDLQNAPSKQLRSPLGRDVRIAVRELAAVGDLPIFPGRFGTAAYALLNIVTLVATMVFVVG